MKHLVAIFFGVGLTPLAPGTAASLVAIVIGLLAFEFAGIAALIALTVLTIILGFWATSSYSAPLQDAPEIVIDEVAGQLIAALPVPLYIYSFSGSFSPNWIWIAAFALFRLFDIWKPGIIGQIDSRSEVMERAIMLDDILAGIYAAIILLILWGSLRLLLN